jgi:hypothetical protein
MLRMFSIVTPLPRPAYKWYQTNLTEITERLGDGIKGVVIEKALMNINITKCSPVSTQSFLEDESSYGQNQEGDRCNEQQV